MLVAFTSTVKFSNIDFPLWNFMRFLKFYYENDFCQSLLFKSLEIRLSTINWIAETEENLS